MSLVRRMRRKRKATVLRGPMWHVRWNDDRTVGKLWRVRSWDGKGGTQRFPASPCLEGIIRRGSAVTRSGESDSER